MRRPAWFPDKRPALEAIDQLIRELALARGASEDQAADISDRFWQMFGHVAVSREGARDVAEWVRLEVEFGA